MSKSNLRLRVNVICQELFDEKGKSLGHLPERDLFRRMDYWDLRRLSEVNPLLCDPKFLKEDLTPEQQAQRSAFMRPRMTDLWGGTRKFKPIEPPSKVVPFFAVPPEEQGDNCTDEAAASIQEAAALAIEPTPNHSDDPAERQELVITAPVTDSMVVLAPPGTGKTYTLVERIRHLVESRQIENPSDEILVLSFTNAAVAEITKRVIEKTKTGSQDDLRYVNVRTFDSFATVMLLKDEDSALLSGLGFDGRIVRFTDQLKRRNIPEAASSVDQIRYLIVDEIQDVCGQRAEMVLELIRRVTRHGGGVLLLGDPAQAIYGWDEQSSGDLSPEQFLRRAIEVLGPDAQAVSLTRFYRFKTERMAHVVQQAREAMGEDGRSPDGGRLREILSELGTTVDVADLAHIARERDLAILTRTNLEAWQISEWCNKNGVPHELWRGATGAYWPGWIARLVGGFEGEVMGLPMARRRWDKLIGGAVAPAFDEAWSFLVRQGAASNDQLELRALNELIKRRSPFSIEPASQSKLIISTIHRSKGLEFNRVLIVEPMADRVSGDAFEVRVLYVAATRATEDLKVLGRSRAVFNRGYKNHPRRLYKDLAHFHTYHNDINWLLLDGLEDLDAMSLLQAFHQNPEAAWESQQGLWEQLAHTGGVCAAARQEKRFVLRLPRAGSDTTGVDVCDLSGAVASDLVKLGWAFRGDPSGVIGLRDIPVQGLATVAFDFRDRDVAGTLGSARLALLPVIHGEAVIQMTAGRQDD